VERAPDDRGETTAISGRAWWVLILGSMCSFATALNLSVMTVAFPALKESFPGVSAAQLSWVINSYTILGGALLILAGVVGERYGRKRTLLTGLSLFTLGAAACALAPNPSVLIGARCFAAIGAALLTPATVSVILADFPAERRGTAIATWAGIGGIATALGPAVGAVVIELGSWRWAFWINVPFGVVVVALGLRTFSETPRDELVRGPLPDPVGALCVLGGVTLWILGLVQSPSWGWADARTIGSLVAGTALVLYLLWRSARVAAPMIDLDLVRYRNMRLGALLDLGFGTSFFAMSLGLVLFLTQVWGYSLVAAGGLVTPIATTLTVLSPVTGRLADRHGHRVLAVPGGLCWAAGGAWLLLAAGDEPDLARVWFPALLLMGLGSACAWPTIHGIPVIGVPPSKVGLATATNQTVLRVSAALGVAIAVTMVSGDADQGAVAFRELFVLLIVSGLMLTLIGWFVRTGPDAPAVQLRSAGGLPAPVTADAR
jgi:EmrB/QacA subfamily drug resistance transporter